MNFGDALINLKNGEWLTRLGWNGSGMFIYLVAGSRFSKAQARPPLHSEMADDRGEFKYRPHIDMKTADGSLVPWVASQTDILADDWQVYP